MAKKDKKVKKAKGAEKAKGGAKTYKVLDADSNKIRIENVRLSFPSLFTPKTVGDDANSTPKFSGVFLLDDKKHADAIEFLQETAEGLAKSVGMKKLSITKSFLKPGSEKDEIEGFEDTHFISASNARRPLSLDEDKSALAESDGKLYAGCYVNVIVQIWAQDNKFGKRVNASLEGVQFNDDGEPMAGGAVADESDFD